MNKHSVRRNDEDDEDEAEEVESDVEQDVETDSLPRRRIRPAELMFSTTGRLALGVFGVLILLGGAAVVNHFVNKKDAPVAKQTEKTKATSPAKKTAPAEKPSAPATSTTEGGTHPVQPASATKDKGYQPSDPGQFDATPPETSREFDPYPDYRNQDPNAKNLVHEEPPAAAAASIDPEEGDPTTPAAPNPLRDTERATPIQPTRNYQAQEGESLFDIARYELRDASRWLEIYELNAATLENQLDALPAGRK